MSRIGYARVSTRDQNLDLQLAALKEAGCENIFIEKASGVKARPKLMEALSYLRSNDTLVVYKFDRIGRSLKDLINIFSSLQQRDIGLVSLKDNIDASTSSGRFMLNVFAALAEFERCMIIERCQAGRREARQKGKQFGRPTGLPQKRVESCAALYKAGIPIADIQQQLGIKSKSTVYRYLAFVKAKHNRRLK